MNDPLNHATPSRRQWQGSTALRSVLLFVNFFLILLAYYLVKPASRSLFLEHSSSDALPYVWTASGLLLLVLVPSYQGLLKRYGRMRTVLGSCVATAGALLIFRSLFHHAGPPTAIAFYVLVDIFSVVLVEQFWSLTNSVYDSKEGKRWYGLIASGGLVGGMVGGLTASTLVDTGLLDTPDLISVAAALVLFMMLLTSRLARAGLYREKPAVAAARLEAQAQPVDFGLVWDSILSNRFILLITLLLLFSQVCEPIVEYQFMHHVEQTYTDQNARTVFLSEFLSLLSAIALGINLLLTPLIHRYLGVVGGLMVQPVLLGMASLAYLVHIDLRMAMAMKLTDRGLSYSINRASRELLYVGADAARIFKVKAWIDMVGYRTFKIVGNVAIIGISALPDRFGDYMLGGVVLSICVAWALAVWALRSTRRAPPKARPIGDAMPHA
ncbi:MULTISPECIES: Npt1/Npt2 family nucleotide transporter [Hydrocarboniphaga]|uniref:ADP,ATP carrier protein n=1 Tax=Hydrocarboniphaga effusa AP103 TaxID=1172194 RepID=I7ZB07_9GAMM|nr:MULTISPECIES: Npt1/Npt2 family nucleotide transporter [Hydrocarboniphaga]EIT69029.1 hypothetical protein WQQ_26110 [Hydrocarboniphaga effusa AP103]MDZ4081092.1 Npt1/Npt2 family nucleotide transporter [Hydrocarboniphaga sp.]